MRRSYGRLKAPFFACSYTFPNKKSSKVFTLELFFQKYLFGNRNLFGCSIIVYLITRKLADDS